MRRPNLQNVNLGAFVEPTEGWAGIKFPFRWTTQTLKKRRRTSLARACQQKPNNHENPGIIEGKLRHGRPGSGLFTTPSSGHNTVVSTGLIAERLNQPQPRNDMILAYTNASGTNYTVQSPRPESMPLISRVCPIGPGVAGLSC